jgi:hypothetical protein
MDDDGTTLGACVAAGAGPDDVGDTCTESQDAYWGTCGADALCAQVDADAPSPVCLGFCDAQDTSNCLGASVCVTNVFSEGLEALGVCLGECDPFAAGGCARGQVCNFTGRVGARAGAVEPAEGLCAPGDQSAAVGEPCTFDEVTGGSDCVAGSLCAAIAQGEPAVCVDLCRDEAGAEPCARGTECVTGVFGGDALGFGSAQIVGVCLATP